DDIRLAPVDDWLPHERLSEEFSAIGFYLSGHPLDGYEAALKRLGAVTHAAIQEDRRRSGFRAQVAGTIIRKQERRGRSEQTYAFVSLSDTTGMFEVMVFSEVLAAARAFLEPGKSVLFTVAADWIDDELKLRFNSATMLLRFEPTVCMPRCGTANRLLNTMMEPCMSAQGTTFLEQTVRPVRHGHRVASGIFAPCVPRYELVLADSIEWMKR